MTAHVGGVEMDHFPALSPEVTPELTPEVTAEPVLTPNPVDLLLGGAVYAMWRDDTLDGSGGFWPSWPEVVIATDPPPPLETEEPPMSMPPDEGGIVTDGDGGSLQVLEPPASMGLLDTIVGGVVASFLGN